MIRQLILPYVTPLKCKRKVYNIKIVISLSYLHFVMTFNHFGSFDKFMAINTNTFRLFGFEVIKFLHLYKNKMRLKGVYSNISKGTEKFFPDLRVISKLLIRKNNTFSNKKTSILKNGYNIHLFTLVKFHYTRKQSFNILNGNYNYNKYYVVQI